MPRRIEGSNGEAGIILPGGWVLDAGDQVVVPDDEWTEIRNIEDLFPRLDDLGSTVETPTPVPTYRDLQRAVAGGSVGLEALISTLDTDLQAHKADTIGVHGITDTSKLGWNQQVNVAGAVEGDVLTRVGTAWTPEAPAAGGGGGATAWEMTFNFAVATADWVLAHSKGTFSVHVETFDNSNNPIEGNVIYTDLNTVHVEFYFPQAGYARAWGLT